MIPILLLAVIHRICTGAEIELPLGPEAMDKLAAQVRSGELPQIGSALLDAAARARLAGDAVSEAWAKVGIAALQEHNGRPAMAEATVGNALSAGGRRADASFPGQAALWLARQAGFSGRPLRLRHWASIAASEFRQVADHRRLALALRMAALVSSGGERSARTSEALAAARSAQDSRLVAVLEADWGEQLRENGDLAGALRILTESAQALEKLGAGDEAGRARALLARVHLAHGKQAEALVELKRAEGLLQSAASPDALSVRLEMAHVLASLGERKKALERLAALEPALLADRSGRQLRATWVHAHLSLGDYAKVVSLVETFRRPPRFAPPAVLWMQSAACFHLGRYPEAVEAASAAIQAAAPEALSTVSAYRWRAVALDRLGRHQEAARDMLEAARLGEAVLMRVAPDDDWKRGFIQNREDFADDMIAVLWRAGRTIEAFEIAERFRARALLDLIASRGGESETAPPAPPPAGRVLEYATGQNVNILSFWVHPRAIYIWLITAQGALRTAQVPATEPALAALVDQARGLAYKAERNSWRELHRLLLGPVRPWLNAGSRKVVVLAHGPLHRLPFAALLSPAGRYLAEDFELRVAPGAAFLAESPRQTPGSIVLMGAPAGVALDFEGRPLPGLPGARRELEAIAAATGSSPVLVSGAALDSTRVLHETTRAGIVHFATHAVVRDDRPFESFLALSGGGRLTAGEIYGLRLGASLVTLSACRSGSGRVSTDGILGFPRAFLYAGAASVLAPLWDIPDQTTVHLMAEFYRRYRAGASKSAALRLAQLRLLGDLRAGRVSVATPAGPMTLPEHPALWAGFVLMGAD